MAQLTNAQLIAKLKEFPEDAQVHIQSGTTRWADIIAISLRDPLGKKKDSFVVIHIWER